MVVDYFKAHMASDEWERPKLDGVDFASIFDADSFSLAELFSLEEIELVVKESDGNRSPGTDGFNFAFIKQFCIYSC